MSEGLLSGFIKQAMQLGLPIKPQLIQDRVVIEISEDEFKEAVTKGLTDSQKKAIKIEFREGKMVITVKLF